MCVAPVSTRVRRVDGLLAAASCNGTAWSVPCPERIGGWRRIHAKSLLEPSRFCGIGAASSHGDDPAPRRSASSAAAVTAGVYGPGERGIPSQAVSPAVAYGWVEARHGVGIVAFLEYRCHPCHTPRPWCCARGQRQRMSVPGAEQNGSGR